MSKIGYVYIIRNDEHQPNRFKVGQTYDLGRRISELNRETSNVGQFYIVAKFPVEDADKAERECYQTLREFRKAKEFFDGPEATIVSIVKKITEQYTPQMYIRDPGKVGSAEGEEQLEIKSETPSGPITNSIGTVFP